MSAETELKAAVIDRLFRSGAVTDDSVLVSEMVVDDYARRADLVLANGKLAAFEIKSELDTLARLPGQIDAFTYHFEKVVVVVAARFEERASAMVPDGVGLWVADSAKGHELTERRKARARQLSADAYVSMMTVTELRRLLSANGIRLAPNAPRRALAEAAQALPVKDLAMVAREAIKRRYRPRHEQLLQDRERIGSAQALASLHSSRKIPREPASDRHALRAIADVIIPDDHPLLVHAPAGPVLKRCRRQFIQ